MSAFQIAWLTFWTPVLLAIYIWAYRARTPS